MDPQELLFVRRIAVWADDWYDRLQRVPLSRSDCAALIRLVRRRDVDLENRLEYGGQSYEMNDEYIRAQAALNRVLVRALQLR